MRAWPTSSALSKAHPLSVPLAVALKSAPEVLPLPPPPPPPLQAASASARGRATSGPTYLVLMTAPRGGRACSGPVVPDREPVLGVGSAGASGSGSLAAGSSLAPRGRDALDEVPLAEGEEQQHRERD